MVIPGRESELDTTVSVAGASVTEEVGADSVGAEEPQAASTMDSNKMPADKNWVFLWVMIFSFELSSLSSNEAVKVRKNAPYPLGYTPLVILNLPTTEWILVSQRDTKIDTNKKVKL